MGARPMARVATTPLFALEMGENGGLVVFQDIDDVSAFIGHQSSSAAGKAINSVGGNMHDRFVNARNSAADFRNSNIALQTLKNNFQEAFAPSNNIPFPTADSEFGQWLKSLEDSDGEFAVRAALSLYANARLSVDLNDRPSLLGAVAFAARHFGLKAKDQAPSERSFKAMLHRLEGQQQKLAEDSEALLDRLYGGMLEARSTFSERTDRERSIYKRAAKRASVRMKARFEELTKNLEQAHADIRAVEETYSTQLGLQAPVAYWREKRERHLDKRTQYQSTLMCYAMGALGLGGWGLFEIASRVQSATQVTPGTIAYAALGVLLTTILFWGGRLLVRLFVSEHHLALDAEERETMVHTFLALQLKQQVDQKDLPLILGAIFRPTADGIVKDDAAPEIGLASLLSKIK